MKKRIVGIVLVMCAMLALCACSQVKKYTMTCENGDTIKIEVDGKGGYTTNAGTNLEISKDGNLVFVCSPVDGTKYDKMALVINQDKTANLIRQSTKGNNKYIFYKQNDTFNFVELVDGTSTAVWYKGAKTQEEAESTFTQVTCTKK